jgi:hypothetical protein
VSLVHGLPSLHWASDWQQPAIGVFVQVPFEHRSAVQAEPSAQSAPERQQPGVVVKLH